MLVVYWLGVRNRKAKFEFQLGLLHLLTCTYPWVILNRKRHNHPNVSHLPLAIPVWQSNGSFLSMNLGGGKACPTKRPSQAVKVEAPYCIQTFYISFHSEQILFPIQKVDFIIKFSQPVVLFYSRSIDFSFCRDLNNWVNVLVCCAA